MTKAESIKKKKQFIEAYKDFWTITGTARKLNLRIGTVYDWIDKDKEFAEAIGQIEKELFDYVKSKLLMAIREGNLTAIIFFLKHRHPEFQWRFQSHNPYSAMQLQQTNIYAQSINITPEAARKILNILERETNKTNNAYEIQHFEETVEDPDHV